MQSYTFILNMRKVDNFVKKQKKNVCLWIKSRFCVDFCITMCESYPQLSFSYTLIHQKNSKMLHEKSAVDKVIHNKNP